jgi:hypothetical protein
MSDTLAITGTLTPKEKFTGIWVPGLQLGVDAVGRAVVKGRMARSRLESMAMVVISEHLYGQMVA